MAPIQVNPQLHTFHSPTYKSVVEEAIYFLERTPVHPLPPDSRFQGSGVYAIYYSGPLEHYQQISVANQEECRYPIYVGKAVPPGWRAARAPKSDSTRPLFDRLREHGRNIQLGEGLGIDNFSCRFVILEGIETDLISSVESRMIDKFRPVWNTVVDGFGNHDPGSGRQEQARSEWDVLHPGRPWADKLKGKAPLRKDILDKLRRSS